MDPSAPRDTNALMGKMFFVLDRGFLQLLDVMPHPSSGVPADMAVVNAARVSFMGDSKGEAADRKLLFYMLRNGHTSPFEQVTFKFRIKAPLMTWWQLVRHRTMSFNLQSGRYTPFEENDFYFPNEWRKQSASNKQGSEGTLGPFDSDWFTMMLIDHYRASYELYEKALKEGVAKELARVFLPGFSVYYTGVLTVNAHNLMHFLKLRMDTHAQHEIRVYADTLYHDFFKPIMPWTAAAFEEYTLKPMGIIAANQGEGYIDNNPL